MVCYKYPVKIMIVKLFYLLCDELIFSFSFTCKFHILRPNFEIFEPRS